MSTDRTRLEATRVAYLDLVERALLGDLALDVEYVPLDRRRLATAKRLVFDFLERRGYVLTAPHEPDREGAEQGTTWPRHAFTMIGRARLDNVRRCAEDVIRQGVPGDLIEAGVWKGGTTILMRAVLEAFNVCDRQVWVADSFRGLPPPDPGRYPADEGLVFHTHDQLAVSLAQVKANFDRFGLLDDRVQFLEGWFSDTLPAAADRQWALLRLDGDLYQSTIEALTNLYPNLSAGGWVIIDDYGWIDACRRAVDDFRRDHRITDPLERVDASGVCWQRTR